VKDLEKLIWDQTRSQTSHTHSSTIIANRTISYIHCWSLEGWYRV